MASDSFVSSKEESQANGIIIAICMIIVGLLLAFEGGKKLFGCIVVGKSNKKKDRTNTTKHTINLNN